MQKIQNLEYFGKAKRTFCHSPSCSWAPCSSVGSCLTRHQTSTFQRASVPKPPVSTSGWLQSRTLTGRFFPLSTLASTETPSLHTPKHIQKLWQRCLSATVSWLISSQVLIQQGISPWAGLQACENQREPWKVLSLDKITEIKRQRPLPFLRVQPLHGHDKLHTEVEYSPLKTLGRFKSCHEALLGILSMTSVLKNTSSCLLNCSFSCWPMNERRNISCLKFSHFAGVYRQCPRSQTHEIISHQTGLLALRGPHWAFRQVFKGSLELMVRNPQRLQNSNWEELQKRSKESPQGCNSIGISWTHKYSLMVCHHIISWYFIVMYAFIVVSGQNMVAWTHLFIHQEEKYCSPSSCAIKTTCVLQHKM